MFLKEKGNRNASFIIFVLAENSRSHSSMDRIKDSGSFDLGSNPGGITISNFKSLVNQMITRLFYFLHTTIHTTFPYLLLYLTNKKPTIDSQSWVRNGV